MTSLIHAFLVGILVRGSLRRELALLTAQSWAAQGRTERLGGEKKRDKVIKLKGGKLENEEHSWQFQSGGEDPAGKLVWELDWSKSRVEVAE